jgi:phosphoribosyl-ATP pyrophosphohydrolase/phosphoribosyl-AMP cyclohydrolase
MSWLDQIKFDDNGLVPVIVQEATTGELLMFAYANRRALERTRETGRAHYWSRSRASLWMKGETSGNVQDVTEVRVDCDGDAILYRVRQTGPACHTLQASCFFRALGDDEALYEVGASGHILARIEEIVQDRVTDPKDGSYTNYLLEAGLDKILKKVGEEATEVVVAAKNSNADELRAEVADLLFHLVVLLRERNLPLEQVWKELDARFGRAPRRRPNISTKRSTE